MKATLELDVKDAKMIAEALTPDMKSEKFSVDMKPAGKKLTIMLNAETVGELAAGINSCLRLVRTASTAQEV